MTPDELQLRTKKLALRVIRMAEALPKSLAGQTLGRQMLRASTSVSSNYRAARRARSRREYLAKICIVVEEADETVHWLELIMDAGMVRRPRIEPLFQEAQEFCRIFSATRYTAQGKRGNPSDGDSSIAQSPNHQIAI